MTTNIYEVFKDEIWQPEDLTDCIWHSNHGEVVYNKEGNVDDLFSGDGDTYSGCDKWRVEKEGYIIFVLDDGCGGDYQAIFSLKNKQDEEHRPTKVDNMGSICKLCGKGKMFEGCIEDDWHGVLTCTNCKTKALRHSIAQGEDGE